MAEKKIVSIYEIQSLSLKNFSDDYERLIKKGWSPVGKKKRVRDILFGEFHTQAMVKYEE